MANNLKFLLIALLLVTGIWFFKDWQYNVLENKRNKDNQAWLKKADSLRYSYLIFNDKEMSEYIRREKDLNQVVKNNNIKIERIERLLIQALQYRDTVTNKIDLTPVIVAVDNKRDFVMPIVDSTKCMTIRGNIKYIDNKLSFDFTDRQFHSNTTTIGYWERRQWKFLWFKTRLFGKVQATAFVNSDCGVSKTINIEKKHD